VIWYHNNSIQIQTDSHHKLSESGAILDIFNITYPDEGTYHCKIRQFDRHYGESRYFKLHVNGKLLLLLLLYYYNNN